MSNTFEFTKDYSVSSSVIDEVFYNENDNTVVLDVNDELYRYTGVTGADVGALVGADSVGAYYNQTFKPAFGPAEHLGHWSDWDEEMVSVDKKASGLSTPKGLVDTRTGGRFNGFADAYGDSPVAPHLTVAAGNIYAFTPAEDKPADEPTKEFSFGVFDQTVSGAPIAVSDEPTKEFSLQAVPDVGLDLEGVGEDGVSVRVHFTLDGSEQKFKYDADAIDVDEAIEELHDYVSRVGARGKVTKVVIRFE